MRPALLLLLPLLLAWQAALAWVVEESVKVPVKVQNANGREIEHEIHVQVYVENSAPKPRPLLILNHGRAGNSPGRHNTAASQYAAGARWLTGFGFIVAVPIRIGYGVTGGPDVEASGTCASRNYPPVYKAAAVQSLAVLERMRKREDAAQDRAVVMGQSFGGATAITLASMNPPGVQAAVNFAGGGGGDPVNHPRVPCSSNAMEAMLAGYGKTAKIPTLWLYSENDLFWGPKLPRDWFEAFRAAGGTGELVMYPPVSDDGHRLYSRGTEHWQPKLREFLGTLGFRPL